MSHVLDLDIAIIGGGIAGLWLLSRLRSLGYGVLLIEGDRLGAGQTICSQGIIHGGTKYALTGQVSGAGHRIGAMPARWRRCLAGEGEVDLSGVRMLSEYQYLWTSPSLTSKLAGFFAGQTMRSRMESVAREDYPAVLNHPRFRGAVYRLDEPVLDAASLLSTLTQGHQDTIVLNQGFVVAPPGGTLVLRAPEQEPLIVKAQRTVLTAGAGNEALGGAPMQRRPLHMVMARGQALSGGFYAHCLGSGAVPRLTITSHQDRSGQTIWYLGGQLAENGIDHGAEQQITVARRELFELLPWIDFTEVQLGTFRIDRTEARQPSGKRPDTPSVVQIGRLLSAWPTKLAMAPMLADTVIALLEKDGIRPRATGFSERLAGWPRPAIATYPWDETAQTWF